MKRRSFLKVAGAGVAAAGIEGILTAHRAPAFAQGTTVHILRWNDFVPAADKVLREVYAPEVQKALGIKLNVETINANDIPARATAAIQSGNGPDIIMLLNNYPHLYAGRGGRRERRSPRRSARRRAGSTTLPQAQCNGRRQVGVDALVDGAGARSPTASRGSTRSAPRASRRPGTEYREVGKKLKAAKRPIGQTLGNTFGDAPTFTYPFLWSFGGQEDRQAKGKVVLDSKETLESVRFMAAVLEGRARRGRPRLGRHQQQPRVPVRRHQRLAERRVDLRRRAERRGQVQDREGRAAAHRHPARAAAGGPRRARTPTTPRSTTW